MPLEKRMETKMKNYETIEELLKSFKDGEIFLARSIYNKYFSDIYSEANYFKKLERLSKTQKISPITRGIYYVGSRIPKEEDIVSFFTHDQRGIEIGFGLYQKLKLTNLEPSIRVILSSAIEKNDRNIGNIRVISCNLDYTEDICNAITLLEVLKDFESISDISQKGFLEFCKEYSIRFNEKSIDIVLSKLKYKKNTISFLKDILDYFKIPNSLEKYLSKLSTYKHPLVNEIFDALQYSANRKCFYVMSGDIPVASVDVNSMKMTFLDKAKCPIYLLRTGNVDEWIRKRAIDGSRHNSRALKRAMGLSSYAADEVTSLKMDAANITDNYWIKTPNDVRNYEDVRIKRDRLFLLALDKDIIANTNIISRTPELTNIGSQEKAWKFENGSWWLYKNESKIEITSELITCRIGKLLGFDMAEYELSNDKKYIKTKDFTFGTFNLQHADSFVYDHEEDGIEVTDEDYKYNYLTFNGISSSIAMQYLNIVFLDALCANVDRHTKNYGVLTNKSTGEIVKMAPNFDNNESLGVYTRIEQPYNTKIGIDELVKLINELDIKYHVPNLQKDDVKSIISECNVYGCYDENQLLDFIMWRYDYLKKSIESS